VRDIERSIQFYTETLGFDLQWRAGAICSVARDGCPIMLDQRPESECGVWVWIGLRDDALFEVYQSRGVKVRQEPKNYSWAYEAKFEDVDGNVLWLGAEPRDDLPLEDG
jgi:predicted lactoylglutathione lyase